MGFLYGAICMEILIAVMTLDVVKGQIGDEL